MTPRLIIKRGDAPVGRESSDNQVAVFLQDRLDFSVWSGFVDQTTNIGCIQRSDEPYFPEIHHRDSPLSGKERCMQFPFDFDLIGPGDSVTNSTQSEQEFATTLAGRMR